MYRLNTNARTSWVGELTVENKIGADKIAYVAKTILFKVASNRDYAVNKLVNGVQSKERPADFVFCRAHGGLAQLISDRCKEKKTGVGNEGKYVSRFLELAGHLETYVTKKTVPVEQQVAIDGKTYNIKLQAKIDVEQVVFVVKELTFLDASTKAKVAEVSKVENLEVTLVGDAKVGDKASSEGVTAVTGAEPTIDTSKASAPNIPLSNAEDLVFTPGEGEGNCPF